MGGGDPSEHDDGRSGSCYPIPLNSKMEVLFSLSATIYLIGCWLQALEHNFLDSCNMYVFSMNKLFQKVSGGILKPSIPK